MTRLKVIASALAAVALISSANLAADNDGWVSLFDGKTLDGWKASEKPGSFSVNSDGELVVKGNRSHLFYDGPVENHEFKNFEFHADVMTKPHANSGIYIHTAYQADGWPDKGYECQVNNSHGDHKRTGGLYDIKDVMDTSPAKDDVWFAYDIKVEGKHIVISIDGKVTCDYTEPDDVKATRPANHKDRVLSSGTFAIQAHDPGSEIHYKNIKVKPLK
jgi:hypothetical protein